MFQVVYNIISHVWETGNYAMNSTEQQTIYYICGAIIIVLLAIFTDLVYRVFSHFWSGRK